jgi:hypothetical protein
MLAPGVGGNKEAITPRWRGKLNRGKGRGELEWWEAEQKNQSEHDL